MSQKGKKSITNLLIPGAEGWEIWSGVGRSELTLAQATGKREPLAIDGIPNGELTMAFPVRDVSAAPFVAATSDASMFTDLAELHLERSGLRNADAYGTLSDCFSLKVGNEEATLLPVVLAAPPEGGLPKKSPKHFDISARCFRLPEDAIVLWREFGRWVFAISDSEGQAEYFQALPGALFDDQLGREVALGVSQLLMQQVRDEKPKSCIVWTSEEEISPSEEGLATLGDRLGIPVSQQQKPAPEIPEQLSKLLPADIRADRVAKQKSQQRKLLMGAAVMTYLAAIAYFVWDYIKLKDASEAASARAEKTSPAAQEVASFNEKWAELQPIVENEFWPIEQYYRAYLAAPKSGLRITRAEMRNEFKVQDGEGQVIQRSIYLKGTSAEAEEANQFAENLRRSAYFEDFVWTTPVPIPTKDQGWSFEYVAEPLSPVL